MATSSESKIPSSGFYRVITHCLLPDKYENRIIGDFELTPLAKELYMVKYQEQYGKPYEKTYFPDWLGEFEGLDNDSFNIDDKILIEILLDIGKDKCLKPINHSSRYSNTSIKLWSINAKYKKYTKTEQDFNGMQAPKIDYKHYKLDKIASIMTTEPDIVKCHKEINAVLAEEEEEPTWVYI